MDPVNGESAMEEISAREVPMSNSQMSRTLCRDPHWTEWGRDGYGKRSAVLYKQNRLDFILLLDLKGWKEWFALVDRIYLVVNQLGLSNK